MTSPLRDRFGVMCRLEYYTPAELQFIVERAASLLNVSLESSGAAEIARRSRGTPRIANRLLKRVRDFAQVAGKDCIAAADADQALSMLDVDGLGLDRNDRRLLRTIIEKFSGG